MQAQDVNKKNVAPNYHLILRLFFTGMLPELVVSYPRYDFKVLLRELCLSLLVAFSFI